MAESETSFVDRVQKARQLHGFCMGFSPVYAPPPQGITMPAFNAKIGACDSANIAVDAANTGWSAAVVERAEVSETIKRTATQLLNYIKSSTAWNARLPAAKRFADAIRGVKTSRKAPPPPVPGAAAARERQRGGQSYAELEKNWRGLTSLTAGLTGFAPTDAKIQTGTLNGLLSSLASANQQLPGLEAALSAAQQARMVAFFETDKGLADLFQQVKTSVKGQYGVGSPQWGQVKGVRW